VKMARFVSGSSSDPLEVNTMSAGYVKRRERRGSQSQTFQCQVAGCQQRGTVLVISVYIPLIVVEN